MMRSKSADANKAKKPRKSPLTLGQPHSRPVMDVVTA